MLARRGMMMVEYNQGWVCAGRWAAAAAGIQQALTVSNLGAARRHYRTARVIAMDPEMAGAHGSATGAAWTKNADREQDRAADELISRCARLLPEALKAVDKNPTTLNWITTREYTFYGQFPFSEAVARRFFDAAGALADRLPDNVAITLATIPILADAPAAAGSMPILRNRAMTFHRGDRVITDKTEEFQFELLAQYPLTTHDYRRVMLMEPASESKNIITFETADKASRLYAAIDICADVGVGVAAKKLKAFLSTMPPDESGFILHVLLSAGADITPETRAAATAIVHDRSFVEGYDFEKPMIEVESRWFGLSSREVQRTFSRLEKRVEKSVLGKITVVDVPATALKPPE